MHDGGGDAVDWDKEWPGSWAGGVHRFGGAYSDTSDVIPLRTGAAWLRINCFWLWNICVSGVEYQSNLAGRLIEAILVRRCSQIGPMEV